jgi:cell division protein FtsB
MTMLRGLRISTFLFSMGLVYFAVHFFVGQQGLLSWRSYVQRADELSIERQKLTDRHKELSGRIARLQQGRVDPDYIEERAFFQLGLVAPGDVAISLPKPAVAASTN